MTFASDLGNSALFDSTFTLPSSDGTAGQFLQTDGSGTLSFADAGGGITYSKKTTTYTASSGEGVIADTSGGVWTLTLPATPSVGDVVIVADGADWSTNNLTVARNGSTIEGTAEDLVMDIGGLSVTLIFDGTTWQTYMQAGVNSASGGGGGDVVLLSNNVISSTTTAVDIAIPSEYSHFRLVGYNLSTLNTASRNISAYLSYDGGSTFPATEGDYAVDYRLWETNSNLVDYSNASNRFILSSLYPAYETAFFSCDLFVSSGLTGIHGNTRFARIGASSGFFSGYKKKSGSTANYMRIFCENGGDFETGIFRLYGYGGTV